MIHNVGNIELCELFETEPKTQCKVFLTYWDIGIVYCTCGHFLLRETTVNRKFVEYTMGLSVPEYVIKMGRAHGHRYGKKPGDKEYYLAHQFEKKCIHDRFIRDQEFRSRMIENHRDEQLCRRWNALADGDDTHYLAEQEYFHYKNKWWLHSNKQELSTLQRLQQEVGEEPHVPTYFHTQTMAVGGGIGKAPGGLLTTQKVKEEASQVLSERGDPLHTVFWRESSKMAFTNSTYFVTDGSFTADVGLL